MKIAEPAIIEDITEYLSFKKLKDIQISVDSFLSIVLTSLHTKQLQPNMFVITLYKHLLL